MPPVSQPRQALERIRARAIFSRLVAAGAIAMVCDTWCLRGLFVPIVVSSGSMAAALVGPHHDLRCQACGYQGVVDAESSSAAAVFACPNCGVRGSLTSGPRRSGARVWIDRATYLLRAPRRWEVVVCRQPDDPLRLCVKRVVGLPGQRVSIRDGDIWVDGQIARKDLATERAMRLPVHLSTGVATSRWRDARGAWRPADGAFVYGLAESSSAPQAADSSSSSSSSAAIDWLAYHQPSRYPAATDDDMAPVFDESFYDPGESRVLNAVSDLALECQVRGSPRGTLYLRGHAWGDEFVASIDLQSGAGRLSHNAAAAATFACGPRPASKPTTLDWSLVDRQVRLALNGHLLLEYGVPLAVDCSLGCEGRARASIAQDANSLVNRASSAGPQLALGAREADIEVRQMQVMRDIYYLPASENARETEYCLGPDEYLLLGDNAPHSIDGRHWHPAGVRAAELEGRALAW